MPLRRRPASPRWLRVGRQPNVVICKSLLIAVVWRGRAQRWRGAAEWAGGGCGCESGGDGAQQQETRLAAWLAVAEVSLGRWLRWLGLHSASL